MSSASPFLDNPGRAGATGALMDEYARAAHAICSVVEAIPAERFVREQASEDPSTTSLRAICLHVAGAARRYADYIRKARRLEHGEGYEEPPDRLVAPADLRPRLAAALRYTEGAMDGLDALSEEEFTALRFEVRWEDANGPTAAGGGPTYDPEMLIEHAIVHLLRHRRQIESWPL